VVDEAPLIWTTTSSVDIIARSLLLRAHCFFSSTSRPIITSTPVFQVSDKQFKMAEKATDPTIVERINSVEKRADVSYLKLSLSNDVNENHID
jgi:hypothetical protein